jgi:catechol 2,3-dioxygenase-like lactoylglutathione lyase family enzyme
MTKPSSSVRLMVAFLFVAGHLAAADSPPLVKASVIAFVASQNPDLAEAFYRDVLKFNLIEKNQHALVFDTGVAMLRVQLVRQVRVAPYTALGWRVADIRAAVRQLRADGVIFERFASLKQDHEGIHTFPDGTRVGWFKDPDGNVLSITQFP